MVHVQLLRISRVRACDRARSPSRKGFPHRVGIALDADPGEGGPLLVERRRLVRSLHRDEVAGSASCAPDENRVDGGGDGGADGGDGEGGRSAADAALPIGREARSSCRRRSPPPAGPRWDRR